MVIETNATYDIVRAAIAGQHRRPDLVREDRSVPINHPEVVVHEGKRELRLHPADLYDVVIDDRHRFALHADPLHIFGIPVDDR